MDNNSDDQLLIMQAMIDTNSQDYYEKRFNIEADITEMIVSMIDQIKISKSSPENNDSPKAQDRTTVVLANKKAPPLEGGHSTKSGGMWTLKNYISSPKLYELLIQTKLKGNTALETKNLYNHIKMCLNEVTKLR